jgi:hypothetical protein
LKMGVSSKILSMFISRVSDRVIIEDKKRNSKMRINTIIM